MGKFGDCFAQNAIAQPAPTGMSGGHLSTLLIAK
jgi:hypothetical protein